MDPSLMSPEEIEARSRVIVDPCHRDSCRHNRQVHTFIPRVDPLRYGGILTPVTACMGCDCCSFIEAEF